MEGTLGSAVETARGSIDGGLAEFCTSEHPRLVGTLTLYTGDRHLAEELAQEALVRTVMHWDKVSVLNSAAAWTHRVALNLANSSFRRAMAQRRALTRLQADSRDEARDADTPTAVALRSAISCLPKRQRTALILRYYADLSPPDVAAIMGCKSGTVSALVHQAIAALRRVPGFEAMETDDA